MPDESTASALAGRVFGRLTVVRFSHEPTPNRRFWVCLCVCGTERTLREDYIKSVAASCRVCRRLEIVARTGPRRCPSCEQMLARDLFSNDRSRTDGLARYCKACARSKAGQRRARLARRRPQDIVIPEIKRCNDCGLTKDAEEFWSDKTQPDGLSARCASCRRAYHRHWYERIGRSRRLPVARLDRYKLTADDIARMLRGQGDCCAICRRGFTDPRSYVIDHDHATGVVRGLLCPSCNVGIGALQDAPNILKAAIMYLKKPPGIRRELWPHVP